MNDAETLVAIFPDHTAAEKAVKTLAQAGFEFKSLSVVGNGYHTEEKVIGFYNVGDRVKFWGQRSAFWGGLWGLFFRGLFIATPIVGPVVVLGNFATAAISAFEGALVVCGLSAIGAALYSIGVSKDSVIAYESAVKSEEFLVIAHGDAADIARAKVMLRATSARRLDVFRYPRQMEVEMEALAANG